MAGWDASDLLRGIEQAVERMDHGVKQGLSNWGEHVLAGAVEIVPIEEGDLSDSGIVQQTLDGKMVAIGFGSGTAAPYAVPQHEHLEYRHDPGRSAKYLELPFMASKDDGMRIVADTVRGAL